MTNGPDPCGYLAPISGVGVAVIECLDEKYSTCRRLTRIAPVIHGRPDSKFETQLRCSLGDLRNGEGGLRLQGLFKANGYFEQPSQASAARPLITIVTVVFDGAAYLEQTIQSVLRQTYDNLEYIIVDGGSTDGSLDIIRKYQHAIDYWVSEQDTGIYDAMNKGISVATGKYIALLNASDWYGADLAAKVAKLDAAGPAEKAGIIYANYECFLEDLGLFQKQKHYSIIRPWRGLRISHQAMFVSLETYKTIGLYDLSYRLAGDFDFFLRACVTHTPFRHLAAYDVMCRSDGRTLQNMPRSFSESARAMRRAYGRFSPYYFGFLLTHGVGVAYYFHFKRFLVRLFGAQAINRIRSAKRKLGRSSG